MATITLNVPDNIGIDMTELKERLSIYIQSVASTLTRKRETSTKATDVSNAATIGMVKYPKIPNNMEISQEILDLAVGKLPDDVDWDNETRKMWEEMAQ